MRLNMDKVPVTIEEAVDDIISGMTEEELAFAAGVDEGFFLAATHHHLGQALRNEWSLWEDDSPLKLAFFGIQIYHPDDMTGIILSCVHRTMMDKPSDIPQQVEKYHAYWMKTLGTIDCRKNEK